MNPNQSKLREIVEKDWEFSYERKMGFHMMYLFAFGVGDEFKKLFGVGMGGAMFRVVDGIVGQYYSKSDMAKVQNAIKRKFEMDKGFAKRIKKLLESRFDHYVSYSKSLQLNYHSKSSSSLWSSVKKHKKIEESISTPSWILFTFFEDVLTDVLRQRIGDKSVHLLSVQTKITPLEHYSIDVIEKGVDYVTKKYRFLGMFDFFFEPKDRNYHNENYKKFKETMVSTKEIKGKYLKNKKQVALVHKQYKKEKDIMDLYTTYSNLKEWKNFWREQLAFKYGFLINEIAERYTLSINDLSLYTYSELEELLLKNKKVSFNNILKRRKNSLFMFYNKENFVLDNESLLHTFDLNSKKSDESTLNGTCAFAGKVKGVAKIVISSDDFNKINKDDILVTSTTRPDFLPVMEKCAGIITNEGGLLSHAAIVARELKKPCIIGTKIATKVLKDGDLVEVDANSGVVKILKRA